MSYTWDFGDGTTTTTTSETQVKSYAQSDLDNITTQTGTNKISVSLKAFRNDAQYTDSSVVLQNLKELIILHFLHLNLL